MIYNKIAVFDLDGTLFNTPEPHEGKIEWLKKKGEVWKFNGWWGHADSLDTDVFYINMNQWVYKRYLEAMEDPNTYVMLATGRLLKAPGMSEAVMNLLKMYDLEFDGIFLNWGGDTYNFKTKLFDQMIGKLKAKELTMYDDRSEHLVRFKEWAKEKNIKINVIDIVNKKMFTNI